MSDICRGCMKTGGFLLSMFDADVSDKKLPDKLADIADIDINKNDGMPTTLCPKCAYRTVSFYDFKIQVQKSDKIFRDMLKKSTDPTDSDKKLTAEAASIEASKIKTNNNDVNVNLMDGKHSDPLFAEYDPENLTLDIKDEPITAIDPSLDYMFLSYVNYEEIDESLELNPMAMPNDLLKQDQVEDKNNDEDKEEADEDPDINAGAYAVREIDNKSYDNASDSDGYNCGNNLLGSINDTVVRIRDIKCQDGTMQYQCTLCMHNYTDLSEILIHTVDNHVPSNGPFFCVVCEKDCDSNRELRSHIKVHTGASPYICFICRKAYTTKRYLKRHMICHTDFPRHRCTRCAMRFKTKCELEGHVKTHGNNTSYSCSQCTRVFNHKANYKRHLMTHLDPRGLCLPKYPCYICGKRFPNNRTVQTHMRVHTGEKPFTCDVCNRSFSQQGNLVNHIKLHLNPRNYRCEICGKKFNQRSTLRDHAVLHTGEKPYVCNVCGVAFTFSAALRRHMWSHADNKPFGCDKCNAKFVGRYELKRHMKSHCGKPKYKRKKSYDDLIVDVNINSAADDAGGGSGGGVINENDNDSACVKSNDQIIIINSDDILNHVTVGDDMFIEDVDLVGHDNQNQINHDSEKENVDAFFELIHYT
ncbi:zinc finger protein 260-like [Microplitis mediator]|uniref:zinc finger protein 260-like n=1 Tax=Microplitis mediator TaxID=375433 RepID=UPI00255475BC|nr:zinc finger protein 260-like [Microplitis mediator]